MLAPIPKGSRLSQGTRTRVFWNLKSDVCLSRTFWGNQLLSRAFVCCVQMSGFHQGGVGIRVFLADMLPVFGIHRHASRPGECLRARPVSSLGPPFWGQPHRHHSVPTPATSLWLVAKISPAWRLLLFQLLLRGPRSPGLPKAAASPCRSSLRCDLCMVPPQPGYSSSCPCPFPAQHLLWADFLVDLFSLPQRGETLGAGTLVVHCLPVKELALESIM